MNVHHTHRRRLAGGGDSTAPTYSSSEIGVIDSKTVEVTFLENMVSPGADPAVGVTIKCNAVSRAITSGTIQGDKTKIRYVITAGINGDDVITWEYAAASGDLTDQASNALANVTAQTVTNTAWSPTDLTGLLRWYASDDPDNDQDYSDWSINDAIGTWADKSGNASDMTQATGSKKPLYKTGLLNTDLPGFLFDSDDLLENTNLSVPSFTLFMIIERKNYGNKAMAGQGTAFTSEEFGFDTTASSFFPEVGLDNGRKGIFAASDSTGYDYMVWTVDWSSPNLEQVLRKSGAADGTNSATGTARNTDAGDFSIGARGGTSAFAGHLIEIGILDNALAGGDLTNLETYLANKTGL